MARRSYCPTNPWNSLCRLNYVDRPAIFYQSPSEQRSSRRTLTIGPNPVFACSTTVRLSPAPIAAAPGNIILTSLHVCAFSFVYCTSTICRLLCILECKLQALPEAARMCWMYSHSHDVEAISRNLCMANFLASAKSRRMSTFCISLGMPQCNSSNKVGSPCFSWWPNIICSCKLRL